MKTRTKIKRFFEDHLSLQKISIKNKKKKLILSRETPLFHREENLF
jgi:hypothetical protein